MPNQHWPPRRVVVVVVGATLVAMTLALEEIAAEAAPTSQEWPPGGVAGVVVGATLVAMTLAPEEIAAEAAPTSQEWPPGRVAAVVVGATLVAMTLAPEGIAAEAAPTGQRWPSRGVAGVVGATLVAITMAPEVQQSPAYEAATTTHPGSSLLVPGTVPLPRSRAVWGPSGTLENRTFEREPTGVRQACCEALLRAPPNAAHL